MGQEDDISPKSFTLAMDDDFRELEWVSWRLKIYKLNQLKYADDCTQFHRTTNYDNRIRSNKHTRQQNCKKKGILAYAGFEKLKKNYII